MARAAAASITLAGTLSGTLSGAARADVHVRSPLVEEGVFSFEHNGFYSVARKGSAFNGVQSYTNSIGYGVTSFWDVELEFEAGVLGDANIAEAATNLENTFQLLPEGKYTVNLGLFAAYGQSAAPRLPNAVTVGPIIQKQLDGLLGVTSQHTLNVFLSRDVGHNRSNDTGLFYAVQSVVLVTALCNPGVEAFGTIGNITSAGRSSDQQHSAGPVLVGEVPLGRFGDARYEVGYQAGLTSHTVRRGVRWKLEYQIDF